MKRIHPWAAACAAVGLAGIMSSQAAIFSNFEAPTYMAGDTSFVGVDGWFVPLGGVTATITPNSTSSTVLEGTQSARISGAYLGRTWHGLASGALVDGLEVSLLVERPTLGSSGASTEIYLSDDVAGGSTPAGWVWDDSGNIKVFGSAGTTDTGLDFVPGHVYRLRTYHDFTANTFQAYAQNLTLATPDQFLGTFGSYAVDPTFETTGGLLLKSSPGAIFDDIRVVPEPTAAALGLTGAVVLVAGRRRRCQKLE